MMSYGPPNARSSFIMNSKLMNNTLYQVLNTGEFLAAPVVVPIYDERVQLHVFCRFTNKKQQNEFMITSLDAEQFSEVLNLLRKICP